MEEGQPEFEVKYDRSRVSLYGNALNETANPWSSPTFICSA